MIKFIKKSLIYGLSFVNDMLEKKVAQLSSKKDEKKESTDKRRESAQRIWENENKNDYHNDYIRKETSMLASQGKNDHSGSAYHGPGNVDHEKVDSNMAKRNFNNHDSNRLG